MGHVFISYSHQDKDAMKQVSAVLQGNGISVWVDSASLPIGKSWGISIADGIIPRHVIPL